jgi:hypothetical protein
MSEAIGTGRVRAETLVWTQGLAGWMAAGQLPALAPRFSGGTPPPPPPAG